MRFAMGRLEVDSQLPVCLDQVLRKRESQTEARRDLARLIEEDLESELASLPQRATVSR